MSIPIVLLMITSGTLLTIGDIWCKRWLMTGSNWWYAATLATYIAALNFTMQVFKGKNITIATCIIILFNTISFLLINWFYFGEKLSSMQLAGIVVGLIAVVLLEM